ncbi:MAG: hypothetical protein ABIO94_05130, partial [Opitutaceae bacterium]
MYVPPPISSTLARFVAVAFCLGAATSGVSADVVIEWNTTMTEYVRPLSPVVVAPFVETRAYAMAHIAMFDAIDEAKGLRPHRGPADFNAAAAQAAHDVLVHEFPAGTATFNGVLAGNLAAIPNSAAKTKGIAIGADAAAAILAARANDGSATPPSPYVPGTAPGDYQPTPPFDGPPFNGFVDATNWGKVTPFVLKKGNQFRAPPPYKVT